MQIGVGVLGDARQRVPGLAARDQTLADHIGGARCDRLQALARRLAAVWPPSSTCTRSQPRREPPGQLDGRFDRGVARRRKPGPANHDPHRTRCLHFVHRPPPTHPHESAWLAPLRNRKTGPLGRGRARAQGPLFFTASGAPRAGRARRIVLVVCRKAAPGPGHLDFSAAQVSGQAAGRRPDADASAGSRNQLQADGPGQGQLDPGAELGLPDARSRAPWCRCCWRCPPPRPLALALAAAIPIAVLDQQQVDPRQPIVLGAERAAIVAADQQPTRQVDRVHVVRLADRAGAEGEDAHVAGRGRRAAGAVRAGPWADR